jgi:hypothetical protein
MTASKITASHFRKPQKRATPFRNLCINFNEVLLSQARVTAACNAVHLTEAAPLQVVASVCGSRGEQ